LLTKVLLISHTYVAAINHQKIEALSKYQDLEISLLVPSRWKGPSREIVLEKREAKGYGIYSAPVFFNGHIGAYFFGPRLIGLLSRLKPDLIYLEEEPFGACAFQVLFLNKLISRAKTIIFTWENIFRHHPFPKKIFEKYVLKYADLMIAGNKDAAEVLRRKGFGKEIFVLPLMGVDPSTFHRSNQMELRKRLGLGGAFVIGFVGRLVKEKGLATLVEVVSGLDGDWKLLLVGRGELKDKLVEQASKFKMSDRVIFVDTVTHEKVADYINCLDVLVLPSITTEGWKEQFGHVLIEAMACEVPVIGSDSGAIPEVIGDAGLIFKEGDIDELRTRLTEVVENSALRKKLIKNGKQRVLDNYTHQKIAEKTHEIYVRLLEGSK